jgi:hypothetical protein
MAGGSTWSRRGVHPAATRLDGARAWIRTGRDGTGDHQAMVQPVARHPERDTPTDACCVFVQMRAYVIRRVRSMVADKNRIGARHSLITLTR